MNATTKMHLPLDAMMSAALLAVDGFVSSISRSYAAAAAVERLASETDATLARRGLTRESATRQIVDRYFA